MTIYYVDSHGSNTAPYDTWAKAANLVATIAAIDAAGDIVYVAHNHAESTAGNLTWSWAGVVSIPVRIICADSSSGEPPTVLATTATVATTAGSITDPCFTGVAYCYGLNFTAGSGLASTMNWRPSSLIYFEACSIFLATTDTSTASNLFFQTSPQTYKDCTFKVAATSQGFRSLASGATLYVMGGSLITSGGATPANLVNAIGSGCKLLFEGFDLRNASSSMNLVSTGSTGSEIMFINCPLPSGWSGVLNTTAAVSISGLFNSDTAATNYRLWWESVYGDLYSETTLVRSGGANAGSLPFSWKIVTNTIPSFPFFTAFETLDIIQWNEKTGSPITATVEMLHDSVTALLDTEIWLKVTYLNNEGVPLSTSVSDMAGMFASGVAQTASSATWDTTGMSNPNKQKLEVTFTPMMKGYIRAVVGVAKASYTVYVDPKITGVVGNESVTLQRQIPNGPYINEAVPIPTTLLGQASL